MKWLRPLAVLLLIPTHNIALGADVPRPDAAALARVTVYADVVREKFHLAPVDDALRADPDAKIKLAFIYVALSHTMEVNIHQMGGATKNKVYVSPDGHNEAVVDEHGKLVTDCANQASYNYFPADRKPLEHFLFDMLIWIELGNCPSDPTSRDQRITAYLKDFRNGAIQTFNRPAPSLPADFKFDGKGQAEAAAFFLRALRDAPARDIAALYTQSAAADDFERFFTQFSRAFARSFE